jgi:hypothetical protein
MSATINNFPFLLMHYAVEFASRVWREVEGDWGEDRGIGGSLLGSRAAGVRM